VEGDATQVTLVGGGASFRVPGSVPPGSYKVRASFDGNQAVDAGSVTVGAGATVSVRCESFLMQCR